MKNERNAGRKPKISEIELNSIRQRIEQGESISKIATEYGISRQALHARLAKQDSIISLDYYIDGSCATRIDMDYRRETLHITNYAEKLSKRAFGIKSNPSWEDLEQFVLGCYIEKYAPNVESSNVMICREQFEYSLGLKDALKDNGKLRLADDTVCDPSPVFTISNKDIIITRTDTDGFQLKALSADKRHFIKSQAVIGGAYMDDWAVELIATDLCRQLDIPCVLQRPCDFIYGEKVFKGVYSDNFEMDGYSFISFESLIEREHLSTKDDEFIKLDSISKLKWCANKLSEIGHIEYEKTLKYMLDLALIDCLVGNVDRHTRNFGLFFNVYSQKYEIPLAFDHGMGLFEHDYYRDSYSDFGAAMRSVYVAPYGEDPFGMLELLDAEFDLKSVYPGLTGFRYHTDWERPLAREYMERMERRWQRIG